MLSPPQQVAKPRRFCIPYPKPCESRGFSILLVGISTITHPEWAVDAVNLLGGSFPGLGSALYACAYYSPKCLRCILHRSQVLCVLPTLAALVSLDFQLYSLYSWSPLCSTWVSPVLWPESTQCSMLEQSEGLPHLLPVLQKSLSFLAPCLASWKLWFHIFCPFFGYLRQEGKSGSCLSLSGSRSLNLCIF